MEEGEDARLEQKPSLIRHLDNKGIVVHSLTWCLPLTVSLHLTHSQQGRDDRGTDTATLGHAGG